MAKRQKAAYIPPEELVARIERHRLSYYASQPAGREPVFMGDEALLDIEATIEKTSKRQNPQIGETIEITLACARTYKPGDLEGSQDRPMLFTVTLKETQRSSMSYFPSEAFWPIPCLIKDGSYTHVELRFTPLKRGRGNLLGLWLGTIAGLEELQAILAKKPASRS